MKDCDVDMDEDLYRRSADLTDDLMTSISPLIRNNKDGLIIGIMATAKVMQVILNIASHTVQQEEENMDYINAIIHSMFIRYEEIQKENNKLKFN